MFIDVEVHDGRKYLTCKRNKCRYQGKYGMEYFVYEIKEGIIIEDDIYLPKPLHFDAIPNTDMSMNTMNDVGQRGVIDIRDKPKTPPKGHTISIKPEESNILNSTFNSTSIVLSDLLNQRKYEWFSNNDREEEFDMFSGHTEYIGETEFVFQD